MSDVNTSPTRDQDVVDLLLAQHEEARSLFGQIASSTGKAKKGSFDRLVRLLAVHETAEEMVVYPVVRGSGPDGDRLADARTAEESEAKSALAELEKIGVDHAEFDAKLATFQELVDSHAQNEEREIFPLLRSTQSAEQLAKMAHSVELAERTAPTHPHPHGPESAVGNTLVGPFVAVVDRVRDALRRRAS